MVACPHCGANGIGLLSKIWSDSACPSTCSSCGQLSYFPSKYKHLLTILFYGLGATAIIGVFHFGSWLPLAAFVGALLLGYALAAVFVPGIPISAEQSATNRRNGNVLVLVVLVVAVALALWVNYAKASNQWLKSFAGAHWDVPPAAGRPLAKR
jgi:hypothetical protein